MSDSESRYRIEPFDNHHRREGFSCGDDALDRYFYQQAGQDQRRELTRAYVALDSATGEVIGYFTLSSFSILPSGLTTEARKKLPRYDSFPAILIGRLAVDRRHQGQGFGGALLLRALRECYRISRQIGAMAVVVEAKNDAARAYYEHFGFRRCEDHEYRLYLPTTEIARLY